jgi:hypothetical protein
MYATFRQEKLELAIKNLSFKKPNSSAEWLTMISSSLAKLPEQPRILILDMSVAEMLQIDQEFSEEIDYVIPTFSKAFSFITSTVERNSLIEDLPFLKELGRLGAPENRGILFDHAPIFRYLADKPTCDLPLPIQSFRKALKAPRQIKYVKFEDHNEDQNDVPLLLTVLQVIQFTGNLAEIERSLKDITGSVLMKRYSLIISGYQ